MTQPTLVRESPQQAAVQSVLRKPCPPTQVKDVMTVPTTWLSIDMTLAQAAFVLALSGLNEGMVINNTGHFVGVLLSNDLLFALLPDVDGILAEGGTITAALGFILTKGRQMADLSILPLIRRDPYTVTPDEQIAKAATLFAHKQVSLLPVLQEGKLIGQLIAADLCQVMLRSNRP